MNRQIAIIINTVGDKTVKRHVVTNALRNYPRELKTAAISYVIKNGIVEIFNDKPGKAGRTAVLVRLTKKGRSMISEAREYIGEKTIWSV